MYDQPLPWSKWVSALRSSDQARSAQPSRRASTRPDTPRCCAAARLVTTSTSDRTPWSWAVSPSGCRFGSAPILARSRRPSNWCSLRSRRRRSAGQARGWVRYATTTPLCASCRTALNKSNLFNRTARVSTVVPAVVWCPAETQPGGWVRLRGQPELTLPSASGPAAAILADAGWKVTVTDDFVTRGLAQAPD